MAWWNSAKDLYDKTGTRGGMDQIFGKGAILGSLSYNSEKDEQEAAGEREAAIKAIEDLKTPAFGEMAMKGPEYAGDVTYDPAEQQYAETSLAGPSAFNGISVDPRYRDEQMAQLAALKDLRDAGGFNMTDRANLAQIQGETDAQARGRRDALMQQYQARGMGGGGMELLAQLNANQAAQNQANMGGLNVAAQAQNRALAAGGQAADLAGNMQGSDWQQQAAAAQAADAISKFNAQNLTGTSQFNAGQGNNMGLQNASNDLRAQQGNQSTRQGVNDLGAQAYNQNQVYNNYQIPQQKYQNESGRAGMLANAYMGNAEGINANINRQAQAQGNILSGAVQMGSSAMSGKKSKKPGDEEE